MAQQPALGLTLPIQRGNSGYFNQAFTALIQARSSLINLLLTAKGERIFQPTFGCGIHGLVFEQLTPEIEGNITSAIQEAVQIWMPFVILKNIQVAQNIDLNNIGIVITFGIKTNPILTDTITLVI